MAQQRFQRKDLKRPDEFVTEGLLALKWARQNTRLLGGIGAGVAVLLLGIASFTSVREARGRQASDDLGQAVAELQAEKYEEAAGKLADVSKRWESTLAGSIARLYAVGANLKAGKYDDAAALLADLPSDSSWPAYLQQQATLSRGVVAEAKGDLTTAATRFVEAASMEGPYTAVAVFSGARVRERAGQKEEARKLYERYTREFPQASDHELATAKLEALKS